MKSSVVKRLFMLKTKRNNWLHESKREAKCSLLSLCVSLSFWKKSKPFVFSHSLLSLSLIERANENKRKDHSPKINQLCLHTMMAESMHWTSSVAMEGNTLDTVANLVAANTKLNIANVDDVPSRLSPLQTDWIDRYWMKWGYGSRYVIYLVLCLKNEYRSRKRASVRKRWIDVKE